MITPPGGSFEDRHEGGVGGRVALAWFCVPWSAPCREQQRILDKVAARLRSKARIEIINVEEQAALARDYRIKALPTLVVLKDGEEVERFTGLQPAEVLARTLETLL